MVRNYVLAGCAVLVLAPAMTHVLPAHAQIGTIFSDPPLRPPGDVPRGSPEDEEDVPALPQGRLLPSRPLQPGQGVPRPGAVQQQPLAPPPGSATAPPNPPGAPPPAGVAVAPPAPGALPPGQRPKGAAAPPAPATLQPGDEVVASPPTQKVVNRKATFSGLDKITGRIISFDADIGETVQFGALRVKPDACYTRPATEAANTDAFVEVDEITLQGEVKRIFSGWMFAASPGLHGVEHPIYDIWLTDCKQPDQAVVSAQPPDASKSGAQPAQKRQPPPKQQAAPRPAQPRAPGPSLPPLPPQ